MSESQSGITGIVSENLTLIVALVLGGLAGAEFGFWTLPDMPDGAGLLASGAVVVVITAWVAGGKIHDLLPEEDGIFLVAFKTSDEAGGEVWELSEDQFADMEVHAGTLFQWPVSKRVYECREYRPEKNEAVANWRESVAASELAGDTLVVDAMEEIQELRSVFEPESQKFRLLKRRLRGVTRKLDRRRAEDQQTILDDNLTPGFDEEKQATVSDVLQEELPEELRPDSMTGDEDDGDDRHVEDDDGEFAGFDLLENGEELTHE